MAQRDDRISQGHDAPSRDEYEREEEQRRREHHDFSHGYGPMHRDHAANGAYGRGPAQGDRHWRRDQGYEPPPDVAGGYGSYGRSAASYENEDTEQFDPHYHQWRAEQIRALDDDYRSWRKSRYEKFAEDFKAWRDGRDKKTGG